MNVTTTMQQAEQEQVGRYRTSFEALEKRLNGGSVLHDIRRAAFERFSDAGFPTTKEEEWRFTNIAPIAKTGFRPPSETSGRGVTDRDISRWEFDGLKAHRLVFVNGHFAPALSLIHPLPGGVKLGSLAAAIRTEPTILDRHLAHYAKFEENAFTALSTAFLEDGGFLYVPDGTVLREPVHFFFFATDGLEPFVVHPRNLIITGKDCRVSVVESYSGSAGNVYLSNAVTEVVVGGNSVIEHDKLQEESRNAYHVGSMSILMERGSNFTSNSIALGGSIVRNNVTAVLGAEGGECTLNGLSLSTDRQIIDNHTVIDHAQPNCVSHELYKAILDGKSRGVFNGKIFVRRDAQKTDAKQTNKSLLLSDGATIDTKPQLEIFADDVKCTHGATVGQLDEEQVFYLRSRGIGESDARDLLTFAFAGDIINRVHVAPLRGRLEGMLRSRLRQGRIAEGT